MEELFKNTGSIKLTPNPDWNWMGWDGVLPINTVINRLKVDNQAVILEKHVPTFVFIPQSYTAVGFNTIPGMIVKVQFLVDMPTLSQKVKVDGSAALTKGTTGEFIATVGTPSQLTTPTGPVPDPVLVKNGRWSVQDTGQQIVKAV